MPKKAKPTQETFSFHKDRKFGKPVKTKKDGSKTFPLRDRLHLEDEGQRSIFEQHVELLESSPDRFK